MRRFKILYDKLRREGIWLTAVFIQKYFIRLRAYKKMLQKETLQERFSDIYKKNFWNSDQSLSGVGSEIEYTESLRNWLVKVIPEYQIRKFVDAPCGDFNWMRLVLPKLNVEYFGFDIVESVISNNKEAYSDKNIHFEVANICKDELPECDLLMVRDCLFHLSNEDINKFLANIAKVDYKYLLTTSHVLDESFVNKDIVSGDFRLINLFIEPFNFRHESVIEFINDNPKEHDIPRHMIFIAKDDVPKACFEIKLNNNG